MSRNPALIEEREMRASPCGVFLTGPFLPLPLGDGCLVALEGTPFRLLPTPAEAVPQQRPDADWAVAHAELLANHLTDPLQRPQLGPVPCCLGATAQHALSGRQPARP